MSDGPSGMRKGLANYGDAGFSLFLRKAFIKAMGYSDDALDRPIVGITNTYRTTILPRQRPADHRGGEARRDAGRRAADPVPDHLDRTRAFAHPTSMFLRNLMAMDTEEMIRAQPMDSVVLIGGCDKTMPAQIMAAASADLPAILEIPGPMVVGSITRRAARRLHRLPPLLGQASRRRQVDDTEIEASQWRASRRIRGTCMVMGTASTMACIVEALGLSLPMRRDDPATTCRALPPSPRPPAVPVPEMARERGRSRARS
jgi:dihydroxy-acid dehydratase